MADRWRTRSRIWLRQARRFLIQLPPWVAGVWMATLVIPGFQLDGAPALQVLALVVVAIPFTLAVQRVEGRGERVLMGWLFDQTVDLTERAERGQLPDSKLRAAARSASYLLASMLVPQPIVLAGTVVVGVVVLWLTVGLSGLVGLPTGLSGLWPSMVAAPVAFAGAVPLRWAVQVLTGRGPSRRLAALNVAQYGLGVAGLWLTVTVLGGVRLEPGPAWLSALTLGALAALFNRTVGLVRWNLPDSRKVAVLLREGLIVAPGVVAANALRLWAISWLSTWMGLTLEIAGGETFLLATMLIAVIMAPARTVWRVWDARERRTQAITQHEAFMSRQLRPDPFFMRFPW